MKGMPGLGQVALMIALALLAIFVTGPKLHKMCRIRGWVSGATATTETITALWVEESIRPGRRDACWVSWDKSGDRRARGMRTNLEREEWATLSVGDPIEVIHVPGDDNPYLRNDVFTSPGNVAFDVVLLAIELGGAAFIAFRLVRSLRTASR